MCIHCVVLCVRMYIVLYTDVQVCIVLFSTPGAGVGVCIVWCHTLCVDVCVVMYIVYVYVIEENKKALGVATDLMCV